MSWCMGKYDTEACLSCNSMHPASLPAEPVGEATTLSASVLHSHPPSNSVCRSTHLNHKYNSIGKTNTNHSAPTQHTPVFPYPFCSPPKYTAERCPSHRCDKDNYAPPLNVDTTTPPVTPPNNTASSQTITALVPSLPSHPVSTQHHHTLHSSSLPSPMQAQGSVFDTPDIEAAPHTPCPVQSTPYVG